jgi:hypothetical protein
MQGNFYQPKMSVLMENLWGNKVNHKSFVNLKMYSNFAFYILLIPISIVYLNNNLSRPLVGEEGMFAFIIRERIFNDSNLLIGNLENGLLLINPEHPILIYWVLIITGSLSQILKFLGIGEVYSIRVVNLIPLFILFYFLKFKVFNRDYINVLLQITISLLILALPVFNYEILKIQTDTLSGNFLFLVFGITLVLKFAKSSSLNSLLILTSFFFIGIGKQEWTFSALSSIFVVFVIFFRFKFKDSKSLMVFKFIKYSTLGLLAGNFLNFIIDPKNYLGGFDVIYRTVVKSLLNQEFDNSRFVLYLTFKLSYLFVPLTLLIYSLILIYLLRNKLNLNELISMNLIGLTCFFSFCQLLFTYYSLDLRYATPASLLSIFLFAYVHKIVHEEKLLRPKSVLIPILVILIGLFLPKSNFSKYNYSEKQVFTSSKCVNYINSSEAFDNYSNIYWISSDLGEDGAQQYLKSSEVSLPLC